VLAASRDVIDIDPVYIMYTSGSTGDPKGVAVTHRGVLDYSDWIVNTFGFDGRTIMANQAPLFFDNSIFDIYGCLRCGGKLLFIPETLMTFQSKILDFLKENDVTSVFWVPTVFKNIANAGALEGCALPKLKTIAFCGEIMPNSVLNKWRKALPDRVYANLYGPTEITDVCCFYIVDRAFADTDPLPIGKACENTRVVILNADGEACGVGERGELCVVGAGVALGYWNDPERSEKAFARNPLARGYREFMYRTGDLAFRGDDGLIRFVGRMDTQIKLKGNRIELGEIENAAMSVEGVGNACALFDADAERIVLFIECEEAWTLRKFNLELKKRLPKYMLAGDLRVMTRFPYTPNDKIDRVKLKESVGL
jgi:amino acid adenylation domain-containing protein